MFVRKLNKDSVEVVQLSGFNPLHDIFNKNSELIKHAETLNLNFRGLVAIFCP